MTSIKTEGLLFATLQFTRPGQPWIDTSFGTDEGEGKNPILIFDSNPSLTFETQDL